MASNRVCSSTPETRLLLLCRQENARLLERSHGSSSQPTWHKQPRCNRHTDVRTHNAHRAAATGGSYFTIDLMVRQIVTMCNSFRHNPIVDYVKSTTDLLSINWHSFMFFASSKLIPPYNSTRYT